MISADPLPAGVQVRLLTPHADERGVFMELHRVEWPTGIAPVQWNAVRSEPGVVRGVHVHPTHDDYLIVYDGCVTVGLRDLRPESVSYGRASALEVCGEEPVALTIPHGVAHGFQFHEPSLHIYAVSHYWDTGDELGCRWDDPALGIPWPEGTFQLSPRDDTLGSLAALELQLRAVA
jgi:dTDP-4-dehydrorhamnose 3,5-epimerase